MASLNDTIEELTKGIDLSNAMLKVEPNPLPPLTHEEKKELEQELFSFVEKHSAHLGTFLFKTKTYEYDVSASFSTLARRDNETLPAAFHIYEKGEYKGTTCSFCPYRIRCLTNAPSEYACAKSTKTFKEVENLLRKKFSFSFDEDFLKTQLTKEGFQQGKLFDFFPVEDMMQKERISVSFSNIQKQP